MPTYEYQCDQCGPFEIWQSIKDNPLAVCPTCGSKVQRLISANVGFVLKGAGFYQNDYKNSGSVPEKVSKPADSAGQAPATGPGPAPSTGSTGSPQASSGQAHSSGPLGPAGQDCGACGGPDPCQNN